MYFQCDECKKIFEYPKTLNAETYYGVASDFADHRYKVKVCPYCEGTYTELHECFDCGALYLDGEEHVCEVNVDEE